MGRITLQGALRFFAAAEAFLPATFKSKISNTSPNFNQKQAV